MKNINELNELETIEKLNELMEHIEKNQWEHLYLNLDIIDNLYNNIEELKLDKKQLKEDIIEYKNLLTSITDKIKSLI